MRGNEAWSGVNRKRCGLHHDMCVHTPPLVLAVPCESLTWFTKFISYLIYFLRHCPVWVRQDRTHLFYLPEILTVAPMANAQSSDSARVRSSLIQRAAVLTSALAFGAIVFPASPLSDVGDITDRTVGLLKTLHLLGFASWFGTVVWTTFIAVRTFANPKSFAPAVCLSDFRGNCETYDETWAISLGFPASISTCLNVELL